MNTRHSSYCPSCITIVDFFEEDVIDFDDEGNMLVECPQCGHVFTSVVNVHDMMETGEN